MSDDRLRRLAEAATPGPWNPCDGSDCGDPNCNGVYHEGQGVLYPTHDDGEYDEHQARRNAEYIAAANPEAVLALLDERDRLRDALRAVEQHHVHINVLAGRPPSQSHTLSIVHEALGGA